MPTHTSFELFYYVCTCMDINLLNIMKYRITYRIVTSVSRYVSYREVVYRCTPTCLFVQIALKSTQNSLLYRAPTVFKHVNSLIFQDFFKTKIWFFKTMSINDNWKITVLRGLFSSPCMFNEKKNISATFWCQIWMIRKLIGGVIHEWFPVRFKRTSSSSTTLHCIT